MDRIYTEQDTNKMTFNEFGQIFEKLYLQIHDFSVNENIKFDCVVPILRSGAIPGMMLAVKLKILKVIPVQLKTNYETSTIDKLFETPEVQLSACPNILICENNTFSASTAKATITHIKEKYPNAKIYYATIAKAYGGPTELENVEKYFFGVETNEMFKANEIEVEKLGLRPKISIFPWENSEDELRDINASFL